MGEAYLRYALEHPLEYRLRLLRALAPAAKALECPVHLALDRGDRIVLGTLAPPPLS
jgi:hypothetical protein